MQIGSVVGCLYVDSKPMRMDLVPIVQNTQDKLKAYLLNLARTHCLDALEQLKERNEALEQRPTDLAPFMEYKVRGAPESCCCFCSTAPMCFFFFFSSQSSQPSFWLLLCVR